MLGQKQAYVVYVESRLQERLGINLVFSGKQLSLPVIKLF
jgi:hypothetical protein